MDTIDEIKALSVKGNALSPQDKKRIKELAAEVGVPLQIRKGCGNCYADAVILMFKKLTDGDSADPEVAGITSGLYWCGGGRAITLSEATEADWQHIKSVDPDTFNQYHARK